MEIGSRNAAMFITLMAASGLTVLVEGALDRQALHDIQFLCLLILAMLTSRLKVRLPGLTGNMSVNLPFLFLAIVQLSLIEAAVIAFASTLVQSLPKRGNPLKPVQVLFNVSTVTTAAGIAYLAFRTATWGLSPSPSISLVLAAGTYFLFNTLPVATIISLTEKTRLLRTWFGIVQLSLPYYVAGAGIGSMITGNGRYMSWALPLAVLPVMFGVYRSYCRYFGDAAVLATSPFVKQKAAGAI